MWRTLIAASLAYGCGHPRLDGYRPPLLDRPLQSFHQDLNAVARDGQKALAGFDGSRYLGYLQVYVTRIDAQLRGRATEDQ
jgi:hypothetical protein